MAAQRAAASNIIRIEMMGDKNKPVRMRQDVNNMENSPSNSVKNNDSSQIDVLVSRSEIASASYAIEGNQAQLALREGSPALKALEQTYLFSEGLIMRDNQQHQGEVDGEDDQ